MPHIVRAAAILLSLLLLAPCSAAAQGTDEVTSLRREVERLKALVGALDARLAAVEGQHPGEKPAVPAPAGAPGAAAPARAAGQGQVSAYLQQAETMRRDELAAARIDNAPIDPEMRGFLPLPGTDTIMRVGGYAKVDAIYDMKPAGDPDMFITSTIPPGPTLGLDSFNLHIRQTRLNLDLRRTTAGGGNLRVFVESDFFGFKPNLFRMRHAYGQWRNLLVGQSFTAFSDVDAMADTLDFEGPPSTVFAFQPQVRFTWKLPEGQSLAVSVEKPTTEVRSGSVVTPRTPAPDGVVRWRLDRDRGHVQTAALLRSLAGYVGAEEGASVFGWGVNVTGSARTAGRDDVRFELVYGHGIGRYVNDTGGLALEAGLEDGRVRALPLLGVNASYQHHWTGSLRSAFTYGFVETTNVPAHGPETFRRSQYVAGNLMFAPTPHVMFGAEVLYGEQRVRSGDEGNATRVQLSMQYDFVRR